MKRRSFLSLLSGLPFLGWLAPKPAEASLIETWRGGLAEVGWFDNGKCWSSATGWGDAPSYTYFQEIHIVFEGDSSRTFWLGLFDMGWIEVTVPPETKKAVVRSYKFVRDVENDWSWCEVIGNIDGGEFHELPCRFVEELDLPSESGVSQAAG